jgi:hypothetical protein
MFHAAIAALGAGSLDVNGNLFDLPRDLAEVMECRSLADGAHVNQAFPECLCVLRNIFAPPKHDACQQWQDW